MTIDEAIEELKKDTEHPTADYVPRLKAAELLGIEALERLSTIRKLAFAPELCDDPLPSETEEN